MRWILSKTEVANALDTYILTFSENTLAKLLYVVTVMGYDSGGHFLVYRDTENSITLTLKLHSSV